jgi:CHAT domain-containing protein
MMILAKHFAVVIALLCCDLLFPANAGPNPFSGTDGAGGYTPPAIPAPAFATAQDLHADPRVGQWVSLWNAGDLASLIAATEADLRGPAPHPFASHVWLFAQSATGALAEGTPLPVAADLAATLDLPARIFLRENKATVLDFSDLAVEALATGMTDYWALFALVTSDAPAQVPDLVRRFLTLYPNDFGAAWVASRQRLPNVPGLVDALADGPSNALGSAGAAFALWSLAAPLATPVETRAAIAAWLDKAPQDANALRRLGYLLDDDGERDAALATFAKAEAIFPFFPYWARAGRIEAFQGQTDAALARIANATAHDTPPESRPLVTRRRQVGVLREAGALGRARKLAMEALQDFPGDEALTLELARIAGAETRHAEATGLLEPMIARWPGNAVVRERLASEQMSADRPEAALATIDAWVATGARTTDSMLYTYATALNALGRPAEAASAIDQTALQRPVGDWLLSNRVFYLAKAGQTEAAWQLARATVATNPHSDWIVARLAEYGPQADQTEATIDTLDTALIDFPWSAALWSARAKLDADPDRIWRMAEEKLPLAAFPAVRRAEAMVAKSGADWENAVTVLTQALTRLEAGAAQPGQRMLVLEARAKIRDDAVRARFSTDQGLSEAALADLDAARALGLPARDYWITRYFILFRMPSTPLLTEAALMAFDQDPDGQPVELLFDGDTNQHLPVAGSDFARLKRYVDRQPRNAAHLEEAVRRHNLYGGSPVIALALLDQIRRVDPDADILVQQAQAYGKLGLFRESYEQEYAGRRSISDSDRYIGWWNDAREKAQSEQAELIKIDLAAYRVTLRRPDGIEEERHYDPVSARLSYLRVGAAWVRFEYADTLELVSVETGSGQRMELDYGPPAATPMGTRQIVAARVTDQPELTFAYGPHGTITRISIEGLGRLDITYTPDGELDEVVATPAIPGGPTDDISSVAIAGFNTMMRLSRLGSRSSDFASLPFTDPVLDQIEAALSEAEGDAYYDRELDLAEALIERRAAHPDHTSQAYQILEQQLYGAYDIAGPLSGDMEATDDAHVLRWLRAATLWHELTRYTYPGGVPAETWESWGILRDWALAQPSTSPEIAQTLEAFAAERAQGQLRVLSSAGWLRQSFLTNPGFWRTTGFDAMLPPDLAPDARGRAVLLRRNGDAVLATGRGFSVLRRGFWEWFAQDRRTGRYGPLLDHTALDGASAISALAEDATGRLWLGHQAGLAMLAGDYDGATQAWGPGSALAPGGVTALAPQAGRMFFGGPGGFGFVSLEDLSLTMIDTEPVNWLRQGPDETVILGRNAGTAYWQDGALHTLTDYQLADVWPGQGGLLAIRGATVLAAPWQPKGPLPQFSPLPEQETIATAGRIHGFATVPVFDGEAAVGVLTDQGISILRNKTFEHLTLPGNDRIEPVLAVSAQGDRMIALLQGGIAMMEHGQTRLVLRDQVFDLVSSPQLGMTFVAASGGLMALAQDDPTAEPTVLAYTDTTKLALLPDGTLIANDGQTILRFDVSQASGPISQELFSYSQTLPDGGLPGSIRDLRVTSDGTIWVIAGASLFRFPAGAEPGTEPEEFSIYRKDARFPVPSDMLSGLFETVDGRIWLVASNEGFRRYDGQALSGGLFEYTGNGFAPVTDEITGRNFISGYTPVSDNRAIVGTTAGMALHQAASADQPATLTAFSARNDASYDALQARHPALFMGTEGAALGDGLFLFGTADGIIAWRDGIWFYPERLNWMLPGQENAAYGSRTVHHIATDPAGRLYIATDLGLTLHDPLGAGPESFLVAEDHADFAFSALETRKAAAVNDILLQALPADSADGSKLKTYRQMQKQLVTAEAAISNAVAAGTKPDPTAERDLTRLKQRDIAFLAQLERQEPQLFNLLQLNPLDLQALSRDLTPGTAIVQYLPGEGALYINLVSRDRQELRRVDVSRAALEATALRAVTAMAAQAGGTLDRAAEAMEAPAPLTAPDPAQLAADLAWLYDQLLRPVEQDLAGFDDVIVAPTGALSYLPFAALLRDRDPAEYAVERFAFAATPSLYSVIALKDHVPSFAFSHLVLGDPDGTLPAARTEAAEVADMLAPDLVTLRIGKEATYDDLLANAGDARFVHFAMHGKLDHRDPRNSFLLLADGWRMNIPQIMTLPLQNADLVFLSACETGIGTDGLEYRTIAQAFNHAGAPSVIASYWKVNDAATRSLALGFYKARTEGESSAKSLALSQRAMRASGGPLSKPGLWAAFALYGKP